MKTLFNVYYWHKAACLLYQNLRSKEADWSGGALNCARGLCAKNKWWALPDSNWGPADYEYSAQLVLGVLSRRIVRVF